MECEEVRDQLLAVLTAGEGAPLTGSLARHVEACEGCRAEWKVLSQTWALLRQWPEASPGEEVRARLVRTVWRQLVRESVFTVTGWTPAVLASVVGVGLSLGLSFLIPYSLLVSLCRQALQVSDSHAAAYFVAGMAYGLPLALGAWLFRRRALIGAVVGSLETSLLFLLILAPYVIVQCREFAPALQAAFVSGLGGAAVVSSLAALALARLVPFRGRFVSFGVLALLVVLATSAGWASPETMKALGIVEPREPTLAPNVVFSTLYGKTFSLKELKGKVVLVNFWATWCLPCQWEMPLMEKLYLVYKSRGFVVVAISLDRDATSTVESFVKEKQLTYLVLLDPSLRGARQFGVTGVPATFLIGADGFVKGVAYGPKEWDGPEARAVIESLLRQGKGPKG